MEKTGWIWIWSTPFGPQPQMGFLVPSSDIDFAFEYVYTLVLNNFWLPVCFVSFISLYHVFDMFE